MRLFATVLAVIGLVMAVGCDKNDKNTLNPTPKTHTVFPAFHVKIENGFKTFAVDSAQLTVTPTVDWRNPVYTDMDGFVGTLAGGTYIVSIDTTVNGNDTLIDTTAATVGFVPGLEYTFNFSRTQPFSWVDTFRINYATTFDSAWKVLAVDTEVVVKVSPDPDRPAITLIDSIAHIAQISDTTGKGIDSIFRQPVLKGYWSDNVFVIPDFDTASTAIYPPDSMKIDTVIWAYWTRIDSFFLPFDTAYWCDSTGIKLDTKTYFDFYNNKLFWVDTLPTYSNCDTVVFLTKNKRTRIYKAKDWANFDTIKQYAYPDTTKELVFGDTMKIHNLVTDQYKNAVIKLVNSLTNDTTIITGLSFKEIMPVLEEYKYPDYKIIIEH